MATQPPTKTGKPSDEEIKRAVRERYAAAARSSGGGCCGPTADARPDLVQLSQYTPEELSALPANAVETALGCGNPLSFAGVRSGDVVLDVGSGAGIDALLAARRVGPDGKVIGLDFTPEMIAQATENAARAGATNVEFRRGDAEHMPLEDASVDWVISNCVINLAPDKRKVFAEIVRVLRPGGQVSISDMVTGELPPEIAGDLAYWSSCVAGALEEDEYLQIIRDAGLTEIQVVSRQHYDLSTVWSFVEENISAGVDAQSLKQRLLANPELAGKVWSARITARKPA